MTKAPFSFPVLLSAGALEAIRLHVLASVFFLIPGSFPFPVLESTVSIYAAVLLSVILRGFGGRIVFRLFLHAIGLFLSLAALLAAYRGLPFVSVGRLADMKFGALALLRSPLEWFSFVLVIVWGTVFWVRGASIGRRDPTHAETVARFDVGAAFFIFVLFIGIGIKMRNPVAEALIPPFFLSAILSLAAARSESNDRGGLPARSRFFLLVPFTLLFFLAGFVTVLFFPDLFGLAANANEVLGGIAHRISPYLKAFLRFIFGFWAPAVSQKSADLPGPKESGMAAVQEPGFFEKILAKILGWGIFGTLGLVLLLLVGFGLWRLVRYLLSRKDRDAEPFSFGVLLEFLVLYLRRLAGRIRGFFSGGRKKDGYRGLATASAYAAMLSWGRFGGISRRPCETPREYSMRLSDAFPGIAERAALVAGLLERELYGSIPPSVEDRRELKRARRSFGGLSLLWTRLGRRFGNFPRN